MAGPEPLSLGLLGPFTASRGGQPVPVPPSAKTRALLAYLAVTGRPHRRDRLCRLLWDVTDDPRGALRWSLSRLRALGAEGAPPVIRTDQDDVQFEPAAARVDALDARAAGAAGLGRSSLDRLRELALLFRGPFLEDLALPDFHDFEAWRVAEREEFRRLHLDLLRELVARLDGTPEEALAPAREFVRIAPDDEAGRADLVRLLVAAGRRAEAAEHYTLGCRELEKAGLGSGELRRTWAALAAAPAVARADDSAGVPRQDVHFCRSADGVRIAYASLGEGPPLVKTANWMSHLEYDWKSPLWRHLARELSREFALVRYDQRGNGLSDWSVGDFSLEACVADLEAVVDAVGLDRFSLLGVSQGSRVAVAYAARHPGRVRRLVLYGGAARGFKHREPGEREARAGLQALIREGWGRGTPAFRQVFTTLLMPGASSEQAGWFDELQRVSTSPENALRLTEASGDVDVTGRLADVRVPALVLHASEDAMVPVAEGRRLAEGIPGARFVVLPSRNHLLLEHEPAFARFLAEVREFLA